MNEILAGLYRKRDRLQRAGQTKTFAYQKAKQRERIALREWLNVEREIMECDQAIALYEGARQCELERITPPLTDAGVRPSADIIKFGAPR